MRLDRVFGVLLATVVVWSALHYRQVVGKVRERVEADAGYPDPASLVKIGSAAAAVYLALQASVAARLRREHSPESCHSTRRLASTRRLWRSRPSCDFPQGVFTWAVLPLADRLLPRE